MAERRIGYLEASDPAWKNWAIANGLDPIRVSVPNWLTINDDGTLTILRYAKLNEQGRKYTDGANGQVEESITVPLLAPYPDTEFREVTTNG